MRILVSWLRDFVTFEVGLRELADVLTMRGFEVSAIDPVPAGIASAEDDAVLDLEITTNRPDCLSVLGIAREVSTVFDTPLRTPNLGPEPAPAADDPPISVTLDDAALCPRYAASVTGVTVGPSPGWLAARLDATDVRPINNVVDVTNYVLMELGHPMHAFDLDRLDGRELRIRRAAAGERVRTLDGEDRELQPEMLVIADATHPQAIAGVMGGAESEVTGATRTVVLESAYFDPISVRRTGRRLGMSTDASYRFERGADVEAPVRAMRRALTLLTEIGAAQARGAIVDRYPEVRPARTVELRLARINQVLGLQVEAPFVVRTLERLGFVVQPRRGDAQPTNARWAVTVPTYRIDVNREIDLIEEVARHFGYDRLPSTFPALVAPPAPVADWLRRQRLLRKVLTASGCSEAITYGFIERDAAAPFAPEADGGPGVIVEIANPLSEKFAVLRPSVLPGLVDSLIRNRRREIRDVRLFEIGKRFTRAGGETLSLGVAITGAGSPEHWDEADRGNDLFDIKGIVERVCEALGVAPAFAPIDQAPLVAGRAAGVTSAADDGEALALGYLGQLDPAHAARRGLPESGEAIYVAELDLEALAQVAADRTALHVAPVPRFPSIVRDLAIIVDAALPAGAVRGTIRSAAPETLVSVREFDRYHGAGVPEGRVSLALRLTFRARDRTLTDAEVQHAMDAVMTALEQEHAAQRR